MKAFPGVLLLSLHLVALHAQAPSSIDLAQAKSAFNEAEGISVREHGQLWGRSLYGPLLFVDPSTHSVVANQADARGALQAKASVYIGTLPPDVLVANTAIDWSGTHWTMVVWPLPQNLLPREILLAHELFHRIQPDLGLPASNPSNPQLDTLDGRLWLQLEWRALAAALITSGSAQEQAVRDALAFRTFRQHLFPSSSDSERALEMNEGLAEYTGIRAAAPDPDSANWRAVAKLTDPNISTFVRSFAYTSGPAYCLLLDQRKPLWRVGLQPAADLAGLLGSTLGPAPARNVLARADLYGFKALSLSEHERAERAEAERSQYRKLLIDGPTLVLPTSEALRYSFDPNELIPLDQGTTVYPNMQASDVWGTFNAEKGALFTPAAKQITLPAPATLSGQHLTGPGWNLDLAPGWNAVRTQKSGSYTVQKRP